MANISSAVCTIRSCVGFSLQMIHDMLGKLMLPSEEKQREFIRLCLRVEEFVNTNRGAITAVTAALMEKKTLTGQEIDHVLKS